MTSRNKKTDLAISRKLKGDFLQDLTVYDANSASESELGKRKRRPKDAETSAPKRKRTKKQPPKKKKRSSSISAEISQEELIENEWWDSIEPTSVTSNTPSSPPSRELFEGIEPSYLRGMNDGDLLDHVSTLATENDNFEPRSKTRKRKPSRKPIFEKETRKSRLPGLCDRDNNDRNDDDDNDEEDIDQGIGSGSEDFVDRFNNLKPRQPLQEAIPAPRKQPARKSRQKAASKKSKNQRGSRKSKSADSSEENQYCEDDENPREEEGTGEGEDEGNRGESSEVWTSCVAPDFEYVRQVLGTPRSQKNCYGCVRGSLNDAATCYKSWVELVELFRSGIGRRSWVDLAQECAEHFEKKIRQPANDPQVLPMGYAPVPEWNAASILEHFTVHQIEPSINQWKRLYQIRTLADAVYNNHLWEYNEKDPRQIRPRLAKGKGDDPLKTYLGLLVVERQLFMSNPEKMFLVSPKLGIDLQQATMVNSKRPMYIRDFFNMQAELSTKSGPAVHG